jgi:hypothetical protein
MKNTQKLVLEYVPFAENLAAQKKKSLPNFIDLEDLKSAAYLGLVEAANRFDDKQNIAFSTFAYSRISGAIYDYLREQSFFKGKFYPVISLNDSSNQENFALIQTVSCKQKDETEENFEVITLGLDEQAKAILKYYFIYEYSMKEVGDLVGISESRVSQLIKIYNKKIKENWSKNLLFLELAA